ncbi:MAG: alpha/beta fold hydrolase [Planctomycetaceae bacterium]|nr:alpha/beta fold hydrolase [Planctomycetaceae bacterium]
MPARWYVMFVGGLLLSAAVSVRAADNPSPPAMQTLVTPGGTRYGLFGEKPAAPAPTLFVLASTLEAMAQDGGRIYTATGVELFREGWLYVTVDVPCHGADRMEGQPTELEGWAHRVKTGQDLFGPFNRRCSEVLDHLIAEGYTDPERVAAVGTSRGGLSALHFAAAEPRVRAVTAISPVTDPLALREFEGVTAEQVRSIAADSLVPALAGRPVGITMGNDDARVNTDACIAFARALVTKTREQYSKKPFVPVELIVGPAAGHTAVDGAYPTAARFLRRYVGPRP